MSDRGLRAAADELCRALAAFDACAPTTDECVALVASLARLEKATAAARLRAAARVAADGGHRGEGFARAAEWLARTSGTSAAEADRGLRTVERVAALSEVRSAFASGELSIDQAHEVATTVEACPGSEHELVGLARTSSLRVLRDEGRRLRLDAIDPEELHRRQLAARSHRHWRDEMGMVRYSGALPPEVGIPLMNRLDVETDRAFRAARRRDARERRECYAADALVRMIDDGGVRHATRADVVYVCDLNTGRNHIVGGGPVPRATVEAVLPHAFVKAVLHDGVRIDTVAHYGRHIPAVLRTALELGDAPRFDGVECDEPDCDRRYGLEWDHVDPVANGGVTAAHNLRPKCHACHAEKTERDRRAGLLDGRRPP